METIPSDYGRTVIPPVQCALHRKRYVVSAIGLHRVLEPAGVLPQAAARLDASARIRPDEVRVAVERLNLDAASFRQLSEAHGGDGAAVREIVAARGKMHNPVTGSGGMLVGVVDEVGPASPLGLATGDRVATLVSLTLTPLAIAARLPGDLPTPLALAVLDVCGAPALTARVVATVGRSSVGQRPRGPHEV